MTRDLSTRLELLGQEAGEISQLAFVIAVVCYCLLYVYCCVVACDCLLCVLLLIMVVCCLLLITVVCRDLAAPLAGARGQTDNWFALRGTCFGVPPYLGTSLYVLI